MCWVTWEEAKVFCEWLSQQDGRLYRLPTDEEWSYAVGLGREAKRTKDSTPESLHGLEITEFPWGSKWPPPPGAGNFADVSRAQSEGVLRDSSHIRGYNDGFPFTAPVMSYTPNNLGLYDMAGNVAEYCEDWHNAKQDRRTLRGGTYMGDLTKFLLSSVRASESPTRRHQAYGFRVVLTKLAAPPATTPPPPVVPAPPPTPPPIISAPSAAPQAAFTNTLGMKFVRVPGTQVQMCIHETRRQDYAAFATAVPGVDAAWKTVEFHGKPCGNEDAHPVNGVNLEDAQQFCAWLTTKEGKTYRLPTDEEWSTAAGLGGVERRSANTTPEMLSEKEQTIYPWGGGSPPTAGNYADSTWATAFGRKENPWLMGYTDGFATAAPVMSFKPNELGIYDLGGNVWEWCEDWYDADQKTRVLRGAAFNSSANTQLLASCRHPWDPMDRTSGRGFRVVHVVRWARWLNLLSAVTTRCLRGCSGCA